MQFLGFLAVIFGPIMEWIYRFIPNYGWALIVFTLLVNLVLLPLRIKQQKSTARMSAFQPKMQEKMCIRDRAARAGGTNIHARALANGLQPFQYLDLAAVVFVLIVLCLSLIHISTTCMAAGCAGARQSWNKSWRKAAHRNYFAPYKSAVVLPMCGGRLYR